MSDLTEFFLASARSVVQIETLQIQHPSFSKTYYIVRNYRGGVTVKLENAASQFFEYLPTKLEKSGATNNLDTGLKVSFGDLGEIIPDEIARVQKDDAFETRPTCIYRVYRSDDLDHILVGPFSYEIPAMSMNQQGATFEAKAPGLNFTKTGELYKIDRFPMLRGAL